MNSICVLCGFIAFNDYRLGQGIIVVVRETEENLLCPSPPPNFPGFAPQINLRFAQGIINYFYFPPIHSFFQGLAHRLFGGKAGGKMKVALFLSLAIA